MNSGFGNPDRFSILYRERFGERPSATFKRDDQPREAAYIATPLGRHLGYALAAAAAGKPFVVEKPAGRSLADFRSMRDAFRAAGVPLFVSYYRRYLPRFLKVKEILISGAIGPITSIDYRKSKPIQKRG